MTEFFGRLAPGATLEQARAELDTAYGAMIRDHREAYPAQAQIEAKDLNEAIQLASHHPGIRLGAVEVRPIKELAHSSAR